MNPETALCFQAKKVKDMNLNTYRFQHCLHDFVIKLDAKGKPLRDTGNMHESHTEEFHHVNITILKLLLIIFSVRVNTCLPSPTQ